MSISHNSLLWASLHGHSSFSLQDGISQPLDIIKTCCKLKIPAFGLTDHANCSGSIKFLQAKKKYIESLEEGEEKEFAENFKCILGQEFYIADSEKENSHLVVLAKNKEGWRSLIKASSEATRKENFFRKPRLTFDQIAKYSGDLIIINGHCGSNLYNCLWRDLKASFDAETYDQAKSLIRDDWRKVVLETAGKFRDAFGDNFYLESQLIDKGRIPACIVADNIFKWVSKELNIRRVATADSHYCRKEQCLDQRILLCSLLKTTLPKVKKSLDQNGEVGLGGFFKSDKYYIPSPEEIYQLNSEEEIKVSLEITQECEQYSLDNKPIIPKFDCPNNLSSDEYLIELCREGWRGKIVPKDLSKEDQKKYAERVKYELAVLKEASLSDYFLLVKDIVDSVKNSGGLLGPGRGSVGGSLVAYLLGIISIDSIEYDLYFERFYNSGRNSPGHISLPDCDIDVQASYVDKTIEYIKEKYGKSKVGKISTYGRLMGRACLKEVLRVHESMSFEEMNRCTKFIPDYAAVADEMELMKEDDMDEPSLIMWALQNNKKELSEWCKFSDGEFQGPFAQQFAQAVRLEGTYKSIGEHAAGIVIFPNDIDEIAPVIYSKDGSSKIAMDMHDIESLGGVKMDLLSLKCLDCIADSATDINNNFLRNL